MIGVRSVVNSLGVMATPRPDEALRKDIQAALAADPVTDLFETGVQVANGTAILTGKVESLAERQLVERVAKAVTGVTAVKNDVVVVPTGKRSDEEIAADVKGALKRDPWVNADSIEVEAKNGVVHLKGWVNSAIEKSQAVTDAWITDVVRVEADSLSVKPGEAARTIPPPPSDNSIEEAIKSALRRHPRMDSFELTAESDIFRVTLEGTVDNFKAKNIAEDIAHSTRGVAEARNYIKVRPRKIPQDAVLAKTVEEAFLRDPYVSRYDLNISVNNGMVRLDGRVDSRFEKTWAADIASRTRGVADVRNNLKVAELEIPRKTDWVLKRDIQNALDRSAFLNDSEIAVSFENGIATLMGTVDSWRAKMAAEDSAQTAGAESVLNKVEARHTSSTARAIPGYVPRGEEKITTRLSKPQMRMVEEQLKSKGYDPGQSWRSR